MVKSRKPRAVAATTRRRRSSTRCYGGWRYYPRAYLESVNDEGCVLPKAIIRQILDATGFASVAAFNAELRRHEYGAVPEALQRRLRRILDGHGRVLSETHDLDRIPIGEGWIENPLRVARHPSPCQIGISGMGFTKAEGGGHLLWVTADVASDRLFQPKRGRVALCRLLIEGGSREFDQLTAKEQVIFKQWLRDAGLTTVDPRDAWDEARRQIERTAEEIGIMSGGLRDESGEEADFWLTSDDENCGLSFEENAGAEG